MTGLPFHELARPSARPARTGPQISPTLALRASTAMRCTSLLTLLSLTCLGACAGSRAEGHDTSDGAAVAELSEDGDDEADRLEAAWELGQAERAVTLAELEADSDMARAVREVEDASRELAGAGRALTAFEAETETRLQSELLSLKRSEISMLESTEELAELEAMYDRDEFADITKELVVGRGRRQLEMAKQRLEIKEREFANLQEHELAEQQLSLMDEIEAARFELEQSRKGLEAAQLEVAASLDEARWKLKKAKEAVEKFGDA